MKNKNFFYQQYDKINWENQEKTKINYQIYNYIIREIILKKRGSDIKIFDIGFGIGLFMKRLYLKLITEYKDITLQGCEPSTKNYDNYTEKSLNVRDNVKLKMYNKTFLEVESNEKFNFITAIYVFPHFVSEDLEEVAKKIYSMLDKKGKFILIVANEKYLKKKLKNKRDLSIEKNTIYLDGRNYKEILHYSDIPQIGKLIDYNREDRFYVDLFLKNKFKLDKKRDFNDSGFICTIFVFEKKG